MKKLIAFIILLFLSFFVLFGQNNRVILLVFLMH